MNKHLYYNVTNNIAEITLARGPSNAFSLDFLNEILNQCRADWTNHYVVYPLPLDEHLQSLIDSYRLILISVEASTLLRFQRA